MSSPYREAAPRPEPKPEGMFKRFAKELERERIGSVVEHLRIAIAVFTTVWMTTKVVPWVYEHVHVEVVDLLGAIVWFSVGLVGCLSIYPFVVYSFHCVYRILGGRRIVWPELRDVSMFERQ